MITTAMPRDATRWHDGVREIGLPGRVRHGLRHTALTWMAHAGVELHIRRRVFCLVVPSGPQRPNLAVVRRGRGGHEKGA